MIPLIFTGVNHLELRTIFVLRIENKWTRTHFTWEKRKKGRNFSLWNTMTFNGRHWPLFSLIKRQQVKSFAQLSACLTLNYSFIFGWTSISSVLSSSSTISTSNCNGTQFRWDDSSACSFNWLHLLPHRANREGFSISKICYFRGILEPAYHPILSICIAKLQWWNHISSHRLLSSNVWKNLV